MRIDADPILPAIMNVHESTGQLRRVVRSLEERLMESEARYEELKLIVESLGVEKDEAG